MVLFINNAGLTFDSRAVESSSVTIQIKATEQYTVNSYGVILLRCTRRV